LGFNHIGSDHSVYIYSNGEVWMIVPIYIDNITLASKSSSAIDKYVQFLSQHFKCCDLGPTRFLLGVAVERNRSTCTIKLHQHQFILDILEKFGMNDCMCFIMSKEQLITSSPTKAIWEVMNSSSPTLMPPIETVLTLDVPLLAM
jgi:hypothetical protein